MKKLKYILLFILFIPFINFNAISKDSVNYKVKSVYKSFEIKNNGEVKVKELYTLEGSFNYFERDILLNNYSETFNGNNDSYSKSSLYNQGEIKDLKAGVIKDGKNPSYSSLSKKVSFYKNTSAKNGDSNKYTKSKLNDGTKIKIFKETIDGVVSFYLEYTITDSIVKHNDIAELYQEIISEDFKYDIEKLDVHILLPSVSKVFKTYAYGTIDIKKSDIDNRELVIEANNIGEDEKIFSRVLFDRDIVIVSSNKEATDNASSIIDDLETLNTNMFVAKKQRKELGIRILSYTEYLYIAFLIICILFVYLKYDKEYHTKFKNKYYKGFLDEYPLPVVEYLINKNVSSSSFTASILNLIYNNRITVDIYTNPTTKMDEYIFSLIPYEGELSDPDEKIINMLFKKRGNNQITLSDIRKYTLKSNKEGNNEFLNDFKMWKKDAIQNCEFYDLYVESKVPIYILILMTAITIPFIILQIIHMNTLTIFIIDIVIYLLSIGYILSVKKRSLKGIEEYAKVKSMRRYIKDFNKLNGKNMPDVLLWDKYIIYATCFNIEDKTSEVLKPKFEKYGISYTGDIAKVYNNFVMFTELNKIFNNTYQKAKEKAKEEKKKDSK